jgi:hypothetical protein
MFERFDRIVECRDGHLFETIWIPMVSFKAVRLGWYRYQFCPVGRHWTGVRLVDERDLSPYELASARAVHDRRVP